MCAEDSPRGADRRRRLTLLILLACLSAPKAHGQEPLPPVQQPSAEEAQEEEDITAPNERVAVEPALDDQAIEDRLRSILWTSQRVDDLEVRVENGVVLRARRDLSGSRPNDGKGRESQGRRSISEPEGT